MKIEIYNNSVEKFIESLEKNTAARTIHVINLLEKFGNALGLPHSKMVLRGIFELRIHGSQNVRIFYAFSKNKAILLHGFIKKTSKIPKKEISIAIKRFDGLEQ
ncbi:MAG: hypothetical protein UT90_C0016G0038 [Parcubacteria group bacterium GW2011_GWA1_40_21]|nr:MAG: hypothetical protein UT90_C0016G0038 [Parcubacteria group bacterium GW2011_GWA1_40_21]